MFFPPERTGGATGGWNRAKVLKKLGYSVFVITRFPSHPTGKLIERRQTARFFYTEELENIKVIRVRLLPIQYTGYLKRMILFLNFILVSILYMPKVLSIIPRNSIAITYARSPILFSSLIGLAFSKVTRSFFVYEAPDLWPEELIVFKTRFSYLIYSIGRLVAKFSYRVPDVIITVSNLAAIHILRHYNPRSHVYGIPVGVDPTKFIGLAKNEARVELIEKGILPDSLADKFIVLYSGLISSAQRIENLVIAADQLKNDSEITILIIGEGPEKQRLLKLKVDLGLSRLHILPSQPREMMPLIISAADVCVVLLSPEPIFDIALPTKFYEYIAACKPIIGVCKGELENIIISNQVGITTKVGDINTLVSSVRYLYSHPDILQRFEKSSQLALQNFSLDSVASMFLKVFEKEM